MISQKASGQVRGARKKNEEEEEEEEEEETRTIQVDNKEGKQVPSEQVWQRATVPKPS